MKQAKLITGSEFFRRLTIFFGITSTVAVAGIAAYLYALMRWSAAEWSGFLDVLMVAAPALFIGTTLLNRPVHAPITRYLDAEARGHGTPNGLRQAFRAVTNLPLFFFVSGLFWWCAAGVAIGLWMGWRFETFGWFRVGVFAVAASSGGFVCSVFMYFGLKRLYVDLRSELGRRIGDPEERESLVRKIDVGRKLRWSVTGVTFVTVAFALFLSLVHVSEPLEANAVRIQQRFLAAHAEVLLEDPEAVVQMEEAARAYGLAEQVVLFDPETREILDGETTLLAGELAEIVAASGTSVDFDSPHAFAWHALGEDGPVVVAVQPWHTIAPSASASGLRFGMTLGLSAFIALALAAALARDIGETTRELGRSAERVASGDLRPGDLFESEDELGTLSRSFERMAGALRATVGRVSETADRVEATAAQTATVSESVASAAESQAQGVVETARAMQGVTVLGLPVYKPSLLPEIIQRRHIDRVLLAMPSLSLPKQTQVVRQLEKLGVEVQALPSFAQLIGEEQLVDKLAPILPGRFLGREQLDAQMRGSDTHYANRTVLITGAGGSIGSELCRQVLACGPKRLVLYELSELALYQIEMELQLLAEGEAPEIVTVLGSVTDARLVRKVLSDYHVDVVLHAAAYKHVPLVEANPLAGLANNVLGTATLARAAAEHGVERFLLVSSDKAVRPTNVMGASKRLAELVVQDLAARSTGTVFAMVRFGNVLGSSGSVIPLFQDQIARGGPVTLTHREVTRYFMTVQEAVGLVLQAGGFARGGEVFVLDMGDPVPIAKLARQMVEAAGYTVRDAGNPDGDIEIAITGLRPGEKLHEELLIGEGFLTTAHEKIFAAREAMLSEIEVASALRALRAAVAAADDAAARTVIARWVEGYPQPQEALKGG